MIKKIIYKTDSQPNHLTLHALFANLVDNEHINVSDLEYKIYYQDRQIVLIFNDKKFPMVNELNSIEFNHYHGKIRLKKIKEEEFLFEKSIQTKPVRLIGTISYAINKGKNEEVKNTKKTNLCPINIYGNFVEGTKNHTLKYLNEKMGTNLFEERFIRDHRFEYLNWTNFKTVTSKTNDKEVMFHNIFQFDLISFIHNNEAFNKLQYCSIGRKRNYGFGNVFVIDSNED